MFCPIFSHKMPYSIPVTTMAVPQLHIHFLYHWISINSHVTADHIHFHIHRLVQKRPQGSALLSIVYKAYVREYPDKIWPYMLQYLYFSILKFALIRVNSDYLGFDSFLTILHSILSLSIDTITIIIIIILSIHYTISLWVNIILTIIHYNIFHMIYHLIYHSI